MRVTLVSDSSSFPFSNIVDARFDQVCNVGILKPVLIMRPAGTMRGAACSYSVADITAALTNRECDLPVVPATIDNWIEGVVATRILKDVCCKGLFSLEGRDALFEMSDRVPGLALDQQIAQFEPRDVTGVDAVSYVGKDRYIKCAGKPGKRCHNMVACYDTEYIDLKTTTVGTYRRRRE